MCAQAIRCRHRPGSPLHKGYFFSAGFLSPAAGAAAPAAGGEAAKAAAPAAGDKKPAEKK
jgi:hypothetical protein